MASATVILRLKLPDYGVEQRAALGASLSQDECTHIMLVLSLSQAGVRHDAQCMRMKTSEGIFFF